MKRFIQTFKECNATIDNTKLTIPKGTELLFVPNCGDATGYAVKDAVLLVKLGAWEHDAKTRYAYIPKNVVFDAQLVRGPLKTKSDNWQETSSHWLVTIAGQGFDFYMGSAHTKAPDYDDVMSSLVMDSSALEQDFEDWAAEYGYDTDSRKAYSIWESCCDNARKLLKTGIDINAERERLADY